MAYFDEPEYEHSNDRQWFGKRVDNQYPKIFHEYLNDGFEGIFGYDFDPPEECSEFIFDQMERCGLPLTHNLYPLVYYSARQAFFHFSHFDPYVYFARGLSDVELTDDWQDHAYQLRKEVMSGRTAKDIFYEPHSEDIESYRLNVRQGEAAFREFLRHPYLDYQRALKNSAKGYLGTGPDGRPIWVTTEIGHELHDIAVALQDAVEGLLQDVDIRGMLNEEGDRELRAFCTYRNEHGIQVVDMERIQFYFEMAAWCTFVWLMSPLSAGWRCSTNLLTRAVHEHGEAILIGYTVFPRGYYTKTSRPLRSCHVCHVQAWCLEEVMHGNTLALMCENCLSDGMPILPPANCGSKLCRMPQCRHHPLFAFDPNRRLHETMRTAGQLMQRQEQNPLLAGSGTNQKLLR